MYKVRNISALYHVMNRAGIYHYIRRIPTDLMQHYSVKRLCFSLRRKSRVHTMRAANYLPNIADVSYLVMAKVAASSEQIW